MLRRVTIVLSRVVLLLSDKNDIFLFTSIFFLFIVTVSNNKSKNRERQFSDSI